MFLVATSITMESTSIVVMVPSSTPPILIVLDLVLDDILVGEGATKGGKKNWGKLGHK
jgi:hypothetical protein